MDYIRENDLLVKLQTLNQKDLNRKKRLKEINF